jgi:hypothetical protein
MTEPETSGYDPGPTPEQADAIASSAPDTKPDRAPAQPWTTEQARRWVVARSAMTNKVLGEPQGVDLSMDQVEVTLISEGLAELVRIVPALGPFLTKDTLILGGAAAWTWSKKTWRKHRAAKALNRRFGKTGAMSATAAPEPAPVEPQAVMHEAPTAEPPPWAIQLPQAQH